IGKLTDYAMLILSQMAREPHLIMSATFLAEALHLTAPTVSKVLKMLSEAGLVNSIRGAEGGYRLARAGTEITVADVIVAMEGGLAMTECCENTNLCAITTACAMRENWNKINNMIHSLLARFTITDMTAPLTIQGVHDG
ncbi:SUF system Fe-S cluster assembly regulator, partial [Aquicella lusitana]